LPWHISKKGSQFCVIKDSDGSSAGCHSSRAKAIKQMRALYANEPSMRGSTVTDMDAPPREMFFRAEPAKPTPMTYDADGSVHGHAAIWGSCHRGFLGGQFEQCVTPPRSVTGYEQFHQGHIITAEGERVAIGKITYDTDHAPLTADVVAASRHYDNTGSVGAYVRATNGRHGIWISGVLREDLAPSAVVALRANPLSGDWRQMNGNLEMVAALAVPVNGFSTPQLALSASATGAQIEALILPGECDCEEEELVAAIRPKSYQRRKQALMSVWR
jgi:hypothetical protein